ncbi:hypothetical protein K402DRAFT_274704 [Aulographum hederae CBS 113979]|uniref:Uncharacterized protein n=1 Tax=Aulographum hederae CBS 113979 TaxID=1176131 RepID=A0A6G1GIX2_9PEZI|nr:hypothetical protein K402DRAFT_274704 [Aulographum hederae CBS 113979]
MTSGVGETTTSASSSFLLRCASISDPQGDCDPPLQCRSNSHLPWIEQIHQSRRLSSILLRYEQLRIVSTVWFTDVGPRTSFPILARRIEADFPPDSRQTIRFCYSGRVDMSSSPDVATSPGPPPPALPCSQITNRSEKVMLAEKAVAAVLGLGLIRHTGGWNYGSLVVPGFLGDMIDAVLGICVCVGSPFFAWHLAHAGHGAAGGNGTHFRLVGVSLAGLSLIVQFLHGGFLKCGLAWVILGLVWTIGWSVTTPEQRRKGGRLAGRMVEAKVVQEIEIFR